MIASLEAGDSKASGSARSGASRARSSPRSCSSSWRTPGHSDGPGDPAAGNRAAEVPLPGVRRRSALESGQAGARLPVLRHRVAGDAADARRRDGRSSSTIWPRRCATFPTRARLAGGEDLRPLPELPGDLGVRSRTRSARAATSAARRSWCRTSRSRTRSVPSRCCRSRSRAAGARPDPRLVRRQWLAPNTLRTKALTDTVKGVYLPYWTFDAQAHARWTRRGRHTTTTPTRAASGCSGCSWTPAAGELAHVFDDDWCRRPRRATRAGCKASSHFRPAS